MSLVSCVITIEKSPLFAKIKLPSPSVNPINQVKKEKEGELCLIIRSYSELNKVKSKYLSLLLNEDKGLDKIKVEVIKISCELIKYNCEKRC